MTEDQFLAALLSRLPVANGELVVPPGDDCAALRLSPGQLLLVAVDQVVGGRHYVDAGPDAADPAAVGRKLLARNLSDIAAMGGHPRYCLTGVSFGPDINELWLEPFFAGLLALADEFGVALIGGDLAATPSDNVASLTIMGEVAEDQVIRRTGALPDDRLFCTGAFGDAVRTGHHLSFTPRCAEGQWLSQNGFANAMIDVSDGLLIDAARLCAASGLGLALDTQAVPGRSPDTPLEACLREGEDYELLLAVSPAKADALTDAWPFEETPLTCIGMFRQSAPRDVCDLSGKRLARHGAPGTGYDHFWT